MLNIGDGRFERGPELTSHWDPRLTFVCVGVSEFEYERTCFWHEMASACHASLSETGAHHGPSLKRS